MSELSKEFKQNREPVLRRYNNKCAFCATTDDEHRDKHGRGLDVHHIVPRKAGGGDSVSNLIPVCRKCHRNLETTQGSAIKELKQSLKTELKEYFNRDTHVEGERVKVVKDEVWEHETHGRITIWDVESKQIGYGSDGPIHDTTVQFVLRLDESVKENPTVYCESYESFIKHADREAYQYSESGLKEVVQEVGVSL